MFNLTDLSKYVGLEYNEKLKQQIEFQFKPYKLEICNYQDLNNEIYIKNVIRCILDKGVIKILTFN